MLAAMHRGKRSLEMDGDVDGRACRHLSDRSASVIRPYTKHGVPNRPKRLPDKVSWNPLQPRHGLDQGRANGWTQSALDFRCWIRCGQTVTEQDIQRRG